MLVAEAYIAKMLSPALLLNVVGLILLGLNNRLFNLTGRIRSLNAEARTYKMDETETQYKTIRLISVKKQVDYMVQRTKLIRTAIFLLYLSAVFVSITVLLIFLKAFMHNHVLDFVSIAIFIASLLFILAALSIEGYEIILGFENIYEDARSTWDTESYLQPIQKTPKM